MEMNYVDPDKKKFLGIMVVIILVICGFCTNLLQPSTAKASTNNTRQLSASQNYSLVVRPDGTVWSFGNWAISRSLYPLMKKGLNNITSVAAGQNFSLALKENGTVWAWGFNSNGELGSETPDYLSSAPLQVSGLTDVTAIDSGSVFSLALKSDGTVWSWGSNESGQLGDGSKIKRSTPTQVVGLSEITSISAGVNFALAIKSDGTLWAWGANYFGQLGNATTIDSPKPVKVSGMNNVIAIDGGDTYSYAVKSDGTVWGWGDNSYGALGTISGIISTPVMITGLTNVTNVAASRSSALALKNDGTVWAWGYNGDGQLGNGSKDKNIHSTPVRVNSLTDINSIAMGMNHAIVKKLDNTVWTWGDNDNGKLGDGTETGRLLPIASDFTFIDIIPPTPPSDLAVVATTNTNALLTWKPATDNVNVISYELYNGADYFLTIYGLSNDNVSGLSKDNTYSFTLKAKDAAGNLSVASNSVDVFKGDQGPTPPRPIYSTETTLSTATLFWVPSTDNVGVTGYNIYLGNDIVGNVYGDKTSYTVSGLSQNIKYSFTIKAKNAAGKLSAPSTPINVLIDTLAPTTPEKLTLSNYDGSSVLLSWEPSTDNVGVVSYNVYQNSTIIGSVYQSGNLNFRVAGLTDINYSFTVKAKDAAGNISESSRIVNVDKQIPTTPEDISYESSSGLLTWQPSTDNIGVVSYIIYRDSTIIGTVLQSTSPKFKISDISSTELNVNYSYTVKAKDAAGNVSGASNVVNAVIDTQAPTPPSKLLITSKTSNSINLSWTVSTDNVGVTSYKVYNGSTLLGSTSSTSYVVQNVTANSLYILKVTALDAAGNESQASNNVYLYTGSYQYHYDVSGRVDYIQFSSGQKLKYNFDANGNLLNIKLQ